MRRAPALLLSAALLAAGLTACSTAGTGEGCATPGDATGLVSVTGELGSAPTISFPKPLYAAETQAEAVVTGDGARVTGGELVTVDWTLLDGRTGDVLTSSAYDGTATPVSTSQLLTGLSTAITCQTEGSRVVAVLTADDAYGPQGGAEAYGVEADDSIVAVIDIERVYLAKAEGTPVPVVETGLPSVVRAGDGTPGVTIPNTEAPTETKAAVLIAGSGDQKVAKDSTVTLQLQAVTWSTGTVSSSTWQNGSAEQVAVSALPDEISSELVGLAVGSQVIVVVPTDGDATIYVIDVLGVD